MSSCSSPDGRCLTCESRKTRLFCNFSGDALVRFDRLGSHIPFPERFDVFEEGHTTRGVFVVCKGRVKLTSSSLEGRAMILKIAGLGDVLGLAAVLGDHPYEVTAETLEPCNFKFVARDDFLRFLGSFGEASWHATQILEKEYQAALLSARRLALSGSAIGRLAHLLLDWGLASSEAECPLRFNMTLRHDEVANIVGTSRETVTRLLNQLEHRGLIKRRGTLVTIPVPSKLRVLIK
jgi:CRP/FNR family transcriptional regulator